MMQWYFGISIFSEDLLVSLDRLEAKQQTSHGHTPPRIASSTTVMPIHAA